MAHYNLIFQGKIIDGASLDEVKNNISRLFKTDAAKTDILFSGKPIVIKKNLDTESAKKYLAVIKKAGAVVKAVKIETPDEAPAPTPERSPETNHSASSSAKSNNLSTGLASLVNYNSAAVLSDTTDEETGLQLAPLGSNMIIFSEHQNEFEMPDISHLSMSEAETGSLEEFAQTLEEIELPDIDNLTMSDANTGSMEEFATRVEPVELPDISALNVTPQDNTPLSDQSPEKTPVDIPDINNLSMSAAQEGSLEGVEIKSEPVEIPETSHLKIEKSEKSEKQQATSGKAVFQID